MTRDRRSCSHASHEAGSSGRQVKLVILDRDGVINQDSPRQIRSPEEWQPLPGALDAIARLNREGWRVVVATNQSGLRRRLFDVEMLNRIHDLMHRRLAEAGGHIEAVFFCPCLPRQECHSHLPNPGMLEAIGKRLRANLETVPFIGDEQADVEAARRAGAQPWLVTTGNGQAALAALEAENDLEDVIVSEDLSAAADRLIRTG